jgi:phenylacetate-CoA ligase
MDKVEIYARLPYFLKTMSASMWGYYLRWWRYDMRTDLLVQEVLDRDSWTIDQWKKWQEEKLAFILYRASTSVPYYRDYWQKRRRSGDCASIEILKNWPVLIKSELRANPKAFLADDKKVWQLYEEHSSGTSGTPITIWSTRETIHTWFAIFEARIRCWNGINRFDRWAILGGQLVTPVNQTTPPYWVWNNGLNQLYLSSYHISPETVRDYITAMERHKIVYLLGYPSALAALARESSALNINPPCLKVVLCNAEPLFPEQKKVIESYFNCPVKNTYGMTEFVSAASECAEGSMHLFPEVGITEVFPVNTKSDDEHDEFGRFVCTGLLNPDMPLIRYEVGDLGVVLPEMKCSCGKNLSVLKEINGRFDDLLISSDGRRIGRMDSVFKSNIQINEAQIIQESIDQIRIKIVPAKGFDKSDNQKIIKNVQERIGSQTTVIIEHVPFIERTHNGKFKAVISKVHLD